MPRRASAHVAPGRVFANRDQYAPDGWRWGPKFDGGAWLVEETRYGPPWAFPVAWSDTTPEDTSEHFGRVLGELIWELEHPAVVAMLLEAEPSTRTFPTAEQQTSVPLEIVPEIVELNELARRRLDRRGRKPSE